MKSDAYSPVGAGIPGFVPNTPSGATVLTTATPLEKLIMKPAVRTAEFYGLQGASLLPWIADAFSSAPIPMWIKLVISATMQVALAFARAWPKSKVSEAINKLPQLQMPQLPAGTSPELPAVATPPIAGR